MNFQQGGIGHWAVNYSGTQGLFNSFSFGFLLKKQDTFIKSLFLAFNYLSKLPKYLGYKISTIIIIFFSRKLKKFFVINVNLIFENVCRSFKVQWQSWRSNVSITYLTRENSELTCQKFRKQIRIYRSDLYNFDYWGMGYSAI